MGDDRRWTIEDLEAEVARLEEGNERLRGEVEREQARAVESARQRIAIDKQATHWAFRARDLATERDRLAELNSALTRDYNALLQREVRLAEENERLNETLELRRLAKIKCEKRNERLAEALREATGALERLGMDAQTGENDGR